MSQQRPTDGQAGFSLMETLIAILVLVFGLIGVINLFLMAGTNNYAAAQETVAANAASEQLDMLRMRPYQNLVPGGSLTADVGGGGPCPGGAGTYFCTEDSVEALPTVRVRWTITALGVPGAVGITVQAVPLAPLVGQRATVEMSAIRTCTAPPPSPAPGPPGWVDCPAI